MSRLQLLYIYSDVDRHFLQYTMTLKDLKSLALQSKMNTSSGKVYLDFKELRDLTVLNIDFSEGIVANISTLPDTLEEFSWKDNSPNNTDTVDLHSISTWTSLRKFVLYVQATIICDVNISRLSFLQHLQINGLKLKGTISGIENLSELFVLEVSSGESSSPLIISHRSLSSLVRKEKLEELRLWYAWRNAMVNHSPQQIFPSRQYGE